MSWAVYVGVVSVSRFILHMGCRDSDASLLLLWGLVYVTICLEFSVTSLRKDYATQKP